MSTLVLIPFWLGMAMLAFVFGFAAWRGNQQQSIGPNDFGETLFLSFIGVATLSVLYLIVAVHVVWIARLL